jgi:hypothetical protein
MREVATKVAKRRRICWKAKTSPPALDAVFAPTTAVDCTGNVPAQAAPPALAAGHASASTVVNPRPRLSTPPRVVYKVDWDDVEEVPIVRKVVKTIPIDGNSPQPLDSVPAQAAPPALDAGHASASTAACTVPGSTDGCPSKPDMSDALLPLLGTLRTLR